MANEILRKLTIKSCGFDTTTIKTTLADQPSVELLKIVGVCNSAQPGQTPLGEFLKLLGQFRAINLVTGEVFDAAACILPNFITEGFATQLLNSENVEFAVQIGVKAKSSSVTGYEYTVRPLIEPKANDAMARLMAAAAFDAPVLEAPKAPKKGGK